MTSVDAVDPAEATETKRPRGRRSTWIPGTVIVALLVGVVAWQGAALLGRIETGASRLSEHGLRLPDCVPQDGYWTSFATHEDVVVAHTLRNPSPWPVTVISTDPEVYRFEPIGESPGQDDAFAQGLVGGTQNSVVVPPDRSVAMWINNPQGDFGQSSTVRYSFEGAPLRVRSLGVEREIFVPYQGVLYVGGGPQDSEELSAALEEACTA